MLVKKHAGQALLKLIFPIALLIVWDILKRINFLPSSIASPVRTVEVLFGLLSDTYLYQNILSSLIRLLLGFCIGSFFGIALGIILAIHKKLETIFVPTLLLLIPVPALAWIPFLITFFGIDDMMKIALISIGGFCTLFLTTIYAVKNIPRNLVELSIIFKKTKKEMISKLILPQISVHLFSSMRVAMALSWTLLLAAEIINSNSGLGWMIWDARKFARSGEMMSGIIIIGLLGKLTDYCIIRLGKHYRHWDTILEIK